MKAVKATGKINTEVNEFWQQISEYQQHPLRSAEQLQQELKQSLTEAGYDSREKIIDLVQDIKREISQERQQKHNEILRGVQNNNYNYQDY